MSATPPGQLSPDGSYYWNGQQWVSTLSPDGSHRWNGSAWVPAGPAPASPPPRPAASTNVLAFQFGGAALWSIGFGLAAIIAPLVSPIYFPILPIFGFLNAVRALRVGRLGGGLVGIALNVVGGIMSLLASGLLHA